MDWLNTLAGETRSRLLRLVRSAALSIRELSDALGITDNAVRTHVAALERDGLVRPAGVARSTGGKPARLYELTPEAEELFPKAYAQVMVELLAVLREDAGDAAVAELLRRTGRRLAAGGTGVTDVDAVDDGAARVAAAATLLESLGGSVRVDEEPDGWSIRAAGCPLARVVAESPEACLLAESLVAGVTGRPVVEYCDRNARPRCRFRVTDGGRSSEAGGRDKPPASSR